MIIKELLKATYDPQKKIGARYYACKDIKIFFRT